MSFFTRIKKKIRVEHQENCFAAKEIPGMKVVKSFGMIKIEVSSDVMGGYDDQGRDDVTKLIVEEAIKNGANAVINFRCVASSYSTNGWSGFIVAYGDAVTLEPTD
jgi:uncharacterized protein YbjQ (UPF0145 family)